MFEAGSVRTKTHHIVLIGVIGLLISGCGINNIPTYDEAVNGRWSEVQNQYKRRADLVPVLVSTVEGLTGQKSQVFVEVTEARMQIVQMNISPEMLTDPTAFEQFQKNQRVLSLALQRFMLVLETNPELRSNENLLILQRELESTENRINVARRDYTRAVQIYNTELRIIPGRWWKRFMYPENEPKEKFRVSADFST